MNKILIFFRHDHFEIWSIDANNRLIPLSYLDSNIVPLYFLISGTDISIGNFAKEQYNKGIGESLGCFWSEVAFSEQKIIRGSKSIQRKELLEIALLEIVFPELIRNYFENTTLESFINNKSIIIFFEPFCNIESSKIIFESLKKKFFNSSNLFLVDYWKILFEFYCDRKLINEPNQNLVVLGSYNSDLYLFFIENQEQKDINILVGKGVDPRLNAVSDFCIDKIKLRGSLVDHKEIRSYITNDVSIILNSLSKGYVEHVFDHPRLGVGRFTLSLHKSVLESRIENPTDLLFIESEVMSFRDRNKCNNNIVLLTSAINLPVFYHRFEGIGTVKEPENFNDNILQYLLLNITRLAVGKNSKVDESIISENIIIRDISSEEVEDVNKLTSIPKAPMIPGIPPKPILPGNNRTTILKSSPVASPVPKPIKVPPPVSAPKMPNIPSKSILTNSKENTKSQEISIKPNATIKNEVKPLSVPLPPVSKVKLPPPPPPPVPKKNK
jgi:hypothetical protein